MSSNREEKHYASIQWQEDGQPVSGTFDDVYFSRANGLEETRHVFLSHNDLARRWRGMRPGSSFTIGETGFGTGLNFLAAWQLWQETAPPGCLLNFISVEKYPLRLADLQRALALWPELAGLTDQLIAQYPLAPLPGIHRLKLGSGYDNSINLTLIVDEATSGFRSLLLDAPERDGVVDAWFLDGFAPAKNPDMWQPELFNAMAALSRPGATAATFTCAAIVKRGLEGAGFQWRKVAGFGHKREMLCAELEQMPDTAPRSTPWHLPATHQQARRVAIVGAGLAGCSAARALAERGLRVRIFDRHGQPGAEASGNPQGILYAKISAGPGAQGAFNLAALQFAQRHYRNLGWGKTFQGEPCGVLQLAESDKARKNLPTLKAWAQHYDAHGLVRYVDAKEASALAGTRLAFPGLLFPAAGWLVPPEACAALVEHPNIEFHGGTGINAIERSGESGGWALTSENGAFESDAVVLCGANENRRFPATDQFPLRPIRGQVTQAVIDNGLGMVVCGEGYMAPSLGGQCTFGATFKLKDPQTDERATEHQENVETIRALLPEIADQLTGPLQGRASLRCTTPDYLPIVGPVPEFEHLPDTYAALRKNRKTLVAERSRYHEGLYTLCGLGSRGIAYAPLSAELLAAWICREPLPVSADIARALHPARFAIRELGRNR